MDKFEAYLIGLAQTDGHLEKNTRNRGKFSLELKKSDVGILKEVASRVEYNYKISSRKRNTNFADNYESVCLRVYNQEFRKFLNENGVPYGKKFRIIAPPEKVLKDVSLHNDYLRGLFDGDGSVGFTGNGFPFLSFTTDSEEIKKFITKKAIEMTGRDVGNISRNKRDDIYVFSFYKETAVDIIRELYYDGCVAIERKKMKAFKLLKWKRPANMKKIERKKWENWENEFILCNTLENSMAKTGRTERSVKIRKWRLKNGK